MYETKTLAPAVVLDASGKPIEPLLPAGMLVRLEDQLHEQVRHMPQVGYTLCHVYCEGRLRWVPTTALADLDDALPGPADLMFVSNVKAFQLSVFDMWTAFTQIMAQARSLSDTCSNLAPDLRDTALAALLDAHVAAARPLIKTFQQAVLALTQGCHQ